MSATVPGTVSAARTPRFTRRRSQVVDAASLLINRHGVRGMTLTAVARALNLDTSSVTYYFKRREQLAAACFERTLLWMSGVAARAASAANPALRVRAFLAEHFALHRAQCEEGTAELALISDLRGLDDEARAPLEAIYAETFGTIRGFFAANGDARGSGTLIAATHLMASMNWLPAWIGQYQLRDFARVEERLFDMLARGLAWPDLAILTGPAAAPWTAPTGAQERFLAAAARLINKHGYAGASAERIAAELGVSTGSFYHHLDTKDGLILACFRRSFAVIEAAQVRGETEGRNYGERLVIAAAELVGQQLDENTPLLRMSAYQALPLDLREEMLALAGRVTRHVAGTVADGVADGSIRPVDPLVASQTIMAAISAASELRRWAEPRPRSAAAAAYLQPLQTGLFGPPCLTGP